MTESCNWKSLENSNIALLLFKKQYIIRKNQFLTGKYDFA